MPRKSGAGRKPKKLRANQPLTMRSVVKAGLSPKDVQAEVMRRFSAGQLRSGDAKKGPKVTSRTQAYAIAKHMAASLPKARRKFRKSGQDDYILGDFRKSQNLPARAGEFRNPLCFGCTDSVNRRRYGGWMFGRS